MNFEPFDYMSWTQARQGRYTHDLSVSGMAPPPSDVFSIDPACMTLTGVTPELRIRVKEAIAYEYGVDASHVLLSMGTSEANFLTYGVFLTAGDAVLVETPAYQALSRLPSVFGVHTLPLARDLRDQFKVTIEMFRQAWQPRVKLVVLTSPHNPSGFALERALLEPLGEWLERQDAYAIIDEVYRDFDPNPGPVAHAIHPRLITTGSLTKVYGLGSLRAGWSLMPPEWVVRAERLYNFMAVNPSTTMLNMELAAFPALPQLRARTIARAAENREIVARWLARSDHFKGELPPRGIIALLTLPEGTQDVEFVRWLSERKNVAVVPGSYFGAPGRVRIAYGTEPNRLTTALAQLEQGAREFLNS